MLTLLLSTAWATDPLVVLGTLFPSADITEVAGRRSLAPISRQGQVGHIDWSTPSVGVRTS